MVIYEDSEFILSAFFFEESNLTDPLRDSQSYLELLNPSPIPRSYTFSNSCFFLSSPNNLNKHLTRSSSIPFPVSVILVTNSKFYWSYILNMFYIEIDSWRNNCMIIFPLFKLYLIAFYTKLNKTTLYIFQSTTISMFFSLISF